MHHLITGGTGFIGRALCVALLADGHQVSVLTRSAARAQAKLPRGAQLHEHLDSVRDVDVVVNLAGEPLDSGRWNAQRKQAFYDSRIEGTRKLVSWIEKSTRLPHVLISGSAIGYYGSHDTANLTEDSHPGTDFLARLAKDWEEAARPAEALGVRVCTLRTGIVLGATEGALAKMLPPFRLGLGGRMGSGEQWMSWVHRDDAVSLVRWLIATPAARGPYNATAPVPVTNALFAKTLGQVLHRPSVLPLPSFILRTLLGEMANLLLTGQKVLPERSVDQGFAFAFPQLDDALRDLLRAKAP